MGGDSTPDPLTPPANPVQVPNDAPASIAADFAVPQPLPALVAPPPRADTLLPWSSPAFEHYFTDPAPVPKAAVLPATGEAPDAEASAAVAMLLLGWGTMTPRGDSRVDVAGGRNRRPKP